jgi:hypothetical protein
MYPGVRVYFPVAVQEKGRKKEKGDAVCSSLVTEELRR